MLILVIKSYHYTFNDTCTDTLTVINSHVLVTDLSSRSQLMESESADEGICTGTQVAHDASNTNVSAPKNQNAVPSLNDIAPSLEQETLMGVRFFIHIVQYPI